MGRWSFLSHRLNSLLCMLHSISVRNDSGLAQQAKLMFLIFQKKKISDNSFALSPVGFQLLAIFICIASHLVLFL